MGAPVSNTRGFSDDIFVFWQKQDIVLDFSLSSLKAWSQGNNSLSDSNTGQSLY